MEPKLVWRVVLALLLLVLFSIPLSSAAHPGNTDGSGCHTCRTNCTERWGIPYDFYHRHNPVRPCSDDSTAVPTTKAPTTTTTTRPTTTTTRAPPVRPSADLDRFLEDLRSHIVDLSNAITAANSDWEERELTFQQARAAFEAVLRDLESQSAVLEADPTPSSPEVVLTPIQRSLDELQLAAQAVIEGLEAPDDGSQRVEAVSGWSDAVDAFEVAAALPETTTTTKPISMTASTPTQAVEGTSVDAVEDTQPVDDPTRTDPNDAWLGATLLLAILAYGLGRRRRRSDS